MLNNLRSLVIRVATLLKGKVDKVPNKSLVSDTLITKLDTLENITQVEVTNDKKIKLTKSDGSNIESNAISGIGGNYLPLTGGTIDPSNSLGGIGIRINRGSGNISGIHLGGEPNSTSGLSEGEYYLLRSSDSKLTIRTMSGSYILDIAAFNKESTKFNTPVKVSQDVQVGDSTSDFTSISGGSVGLGRGLTFTLRGQSGKAYIEQTVGNIQISSGSTVDFKKYGSSEDTKFSFEFDKNRLNFNQGGYIHKGYLVGEEDAVHGRSQDHINPIYALDENFRPLNKTTAGNFYGIGYAWYESSIINPRDLGFDLPNDRTGYVFYVANNGRSKIAMSGFSGDTYQAGNSHADGFIKKGGSDNHVLLAGGGMKLLSEIGQSSDINTLKYVRVSDAHSWMNEMNKFYVGDGYNVANAPVTGSNNWYHFFGGTHSNNIDHSYQFAVRLNTKEPFLWFKRRTVGNFQNWQQIQLWENPLNDYADTIKSNYCWHFTDENEGFKIYKGQIGSGELMMRVSKYGVHSPVLLDSPILRTHTSGSDYIALHSKDYLLNVVMGNVGRDSNIGDYKPVRASGYRVAGLDTTKELLLADGSTDKYNPTAADINGNWNYYSTWKNNLIYVNVPCNVSLNGLGDFTGLSFINRHTGTTTFSGPFTFRYIGASSFQGGYGTSCTVNRYGNEVFVHVNKV